MTEGLDQATCPSASFSFFLVESLMKEWTASSQANCFNFPLPFHSFSFVSAFAPITWFSPSSPSSLWMYLQSSSLELFLYLSSNVNPQHSVLKFFFLLTLHFLYIWFLPFLMFLAITLYHDSKYNLLNWVKSSWPAYTSNC